MLDIGSTFGKTDEINTALESIRKEYQNRIKHMVGNFYGKSVYIVSMRMNVDWINELIANLGMRPVRRVMLLREDRAYDDGIEREGFETLSTTDTEMIEKDINEKRPDLVFTMYRMNIDDGIGQFKIPMVPDLGPFGGLDMMERFIRDSKKPRKEGWRKDAV